MLRGLSRSTTLLYSSREVADALGVSSRTLSNVCRKIFPPSGQSAGQKTQGIGEEAGMGIFPPPASLPPHSLPVTRRRTRYSAADIRRIMQYLTLRR